MRRGVPEADRAGTGGALLSAAAVAALVKAGYRVVGADEAMGWAVARRLDGTGPRLVVGVITLAAGVNGDRIERAVDALRRLSSIHLAGVADAVVVESTVLVLVAQAPGSELEGLIGRRGALTPGEVVTCAVPVLEAVGAVVGAGLGWAGAPVVVIDPLGRPVVQNVWQALRATCGSEADQSVGCSAGVVGGDGASGDATAQVAAWLLGLLGERRHMPVAAERLRTLLGAAADGRWVGGPAELAAACFDVMAPAPITTRRPSGSASRRAGGPATRTRGLRVAVAGAGAAAVGVVVALASLVVPSGAAGAGAGAGAGGGAGAARRDVDGPAVAAAALTYRRAVVLSDGVLARLHLVTVPGSPAWLSDAALVTGGVVGRGQRVHTSVTGAQTVARSASMATVDVWSATWVGERPAVSVVRITLVLTQDGWRATSAGPAAAD